MGGWHRRHVLYAGGLVAGGLAGCVGDAADSEPTGEEDLAIEHLRFASEQPTDYRDYAEVDNATYQGGELVWIYFEPVGITGEAAGEGELRFDLTMRLLVEDPAGSTYGPFEEDISQEVQSDRADEQ